MTPDQYLDKIISIIQNNTRHIDYDRTVAHAKFCRQIMTGEDQDELIVSYKPRESDEQKKQRISLYNSRTKHCANRIVTTFKEVERADITVDNYGYEQDEQAKERKEALNSRLTAYAGVGLKKYVHDAARRLNFYDPNTWVVTEFYQSEKKDYVHPYPLEIFSSQAIMFEYENGTLQYLVGMWPETVTIDGKEVKRNKYTLYGIGVAYTLKDLGEKDKAKIDPETDTIIIKIDKQDHVFSLETFNTGYDFVPAVRVGYKKDPKTFWRTFVSPLDPAEHVFKDIINTKSEYDLHRALHGFLQKYQYVDKCNFTREGNDRCLNGVMSNSNIQCPKCKGSGVMIHTSVQDVIFMAKPDSPVEGFKLSDMTHYVEIPQHVIDRHVNDLEKLEKDVSLAIFNSNVFDRSEIAVTATEKRLNLQSVYNEFTDFSENVSQLFISLATQSATAMGVEKGLIVSHKISKDYALETVDELLIQRKSAVDSGAPYDVLQTIDFSIMTKQNADNQAYIEMLRAQETWRPWKDKSKEEIIFLLSSLDQWDPDRMLYIYFDKVFTKIWATDATASFHKMTFENQETEVLKIVSSLIDEKKKLQSNLDPRQALSEQVQ